MNDGERPATKIVATIGPATRNEQMLLALMHAGVDVFRLNFSHGEPEEHAQVAELIRRLSAGLDLPVAILQDLQGPKIRVGDIEGGVAPLIPGNRITLTSREVRGSAEAVSTTYEQLSRDVKPGDRVLLDDGAMELRVLETTETDVLSEVVRGGSLKAHKGINLPGVYVSEPALTEKDIGDMRTGIEMGVDYVALSFVRRPEDVEQAKEQLRAFGVDTPVIAKLEKPQAIARLDEILQVSDGVMVARGDLGVEMPAEQVPMIQKDILERALIQGVPTITATQMLESMVNSPRPTRAEATDVANAILDGTGAVMLSAETAAGKYPVEAVQMMRRIAVETERCGRTKRLAGGRTSPVHALSHAARSLAEELSQVRAVVPMTNSGYSAHLISAARVRAPIWAYTYTEAVRSRLALWWGVRPLLMPRHAQIEESLRWVEQDLLDRGYVRPGDTFVITGGMPIPGPTKTNFVKLHVVGESSPVPMSAQ